MTAERYDSIANVCMWVAIVSALLFDWMGSLRWLAGGIGLVAGLVSAANYFCNQWRPHEDEHQSEKVGQHYDEDHQLVRECIAELGSKDRIRVAEIGSSKTVFLLSSIADQTKYAYFPRNEPGLYVDEFVKIVNKLSSSSLTEHRHIYEFEMHSDGRCTIRVTPVVSAASEEHQAARGRRRLRSVSGGLQLRTAG